MAAGGRSQRAGSRTSPQGDEGDPGGVEAVVGGELGIEDEVLRQPAMLLLPERDEAEDFLGFLAFADIGVGIAEHLGIGIMCQEGENAGLPATSL